MGYSDEVLLLSTIKSVSYYKRFRLIYMYDVSENESQSFFTYQ